MLFHSSLRRELSRTFGASLVVLVTIIMTMMLVRTLKQASRGSVNPQEIMLVLGYNVLGNLPTVMALCLFIAIVATLSRMYRDSEMVIWFASGNGLLGMVRPLLRFSWPVLLLIAGLALFAAPWTEGQRQSLRDRYEQRDDLERISPGQFQESADGSKVFFIDRDSTSDLGARNVFIATREPGRETVTSARSGEITTIGDTRYLLLSNGQRLETDSTTASKQVSEFETYGTRVGQALVRGSGQRALRTQATWELLLAPTPAALGELSWRVGLVLAACNFVLIGLAVVNINPRIGRAGNLLFAVFAFNLYYNLVNLGNNWIAGGEASFWAYTLLLHLGVFVGVGLWLLARHLQWSWRDFWPQRPRVELPRAAA